MMKLICPQCGGRMDYISELHTELGFTFREPAYYECDACGYSVSATDADYDLSDEAWDNMEDF